MIDREKVIKGLECCIESDDEACPKECPFYKECLTDDMPYMPVIRAALELLKAQEPVMVEERANTATINCPKCGQQFARIGHDKSIYLDTDEEPNYCPKCGQKVKWDD